MSNFFKSSFVWQFAAGFALGTAGLVVLHPAEAKASVTPTHFVQR